MTVRPADANLPRFTRTLADVARALAAVDQSDARLTAALKLAGQVVAYDCAGLLQVVPGKDACQLFAVPNLPARTETLRSRLLALLRLMGDDGCDASRIAAAPDSLNGALTEPVPPVMHLAVPVIGLSDVIGVLYVERCGDAYDDNELRLLTVIAAQLGAYLTTLRLREEELEHARQLGIALHRLEETDRRKDEFLAMLGHELRNPLGAINNALYLIDRRQQEETQRYHRVIERQIKHLSRIVDDLLDASRVRLDKIVLERQPIDLNLIMRGWVETYGCSRAVEEHDLTVTEAPTPVVVNGDRVRLEQVFSNLLTNALKYTPPGGRIRAQVAVEDGCAVIRVVDEGIGMSATVAATVFDLFTQGDDSIARSQGGLGLGLALVRSLVEKHGGTVESRSDGPGRGSEFIVRLPLAPPTAIATGDAPTRSTPAPRPGTLLRVLIIEDNDDARESLRELVADWGHHAHVAEDGLAGVSAALAGEYDVLLVDIGLPTVDGYEVARRVRRERGANAPVLLAMTGYGQPQDRRRAADAGFDGHFVKPVDTAALEARLASITTTRATVE